MKRNLLSWRLCSFLSLGIGMLVTYVVVRIAFGNTFHPVAEALLNPGMFLADLWGDGAHSLSGFLLFWLCNIIFYSLISFALLALLRWRKVGHPA